MLFCYGVIMPGEKCRVGVFKAAASGQKGMALALVEWDEETGNILGIKETISR